MADGQERVAAIAQRPCSATESHEAHVYWLGGNHEDAGHSYRCPGRPAATNTEQWPTADDLHTIGLALDRAEHSRRCEGWYACTCIVGKANAALARIAERLS